jgi:hypothetical protein
VTRVAARHAAAEGGVDRGAVGEAAGRRIGRVQDEGAGRAEVGIRPRGEGHHRRFRAEAAASVPAFAAAEDVEPVRRGMAARFD